jgi:CheY-like chemotaxis protein
MAKDTHRVRILVVDDDTAVRMVLAMELDDVEILEGWRAGSVLDDAITQAAEAVVVDRRLPDGDGLDAVRALRAAPETALLPIVVITADDDPALRQKAFAAGADEHLVKPVDAPTLLAIVRAIQAAPIAERRLRRTLHRARLAAGRDDGGHADLLAEAIAAPSDGAGRPEGGGRRRRGRGKGPSFRK